MSITEIIAVVIGLAMIAGRGGALIFPKKQKGTWKKIRQRPDSSVRMMGIGFLAISIALVITALQSANLSAVVIAAAAGWCIFLGAVAFAVKPLKAELASFNKVDKMLVHAGNVIVMILGAIIVYLVLK